MSGLPCTGRIAGDTHSPPSIRGTSRTQPTHPNHLLANCAGKYNTSELSRSTICSLAQTTTQLMHSCSWSRPTHTLPTALTLPCCLGGAHLQSKLSTPLGSRSPLPCSSPWLQPRRGMPPAVPTSSRQPSTQQQQLLAWSSATPGLASPGLVQHISHSLTQNAGEAAVQISLSLLSTAAGARVSRPGQVQAKNQPK